jgi:hypothetical protein
VQDISEVCFDDEALDTKICDLMASSRKSKTYKKRTKNEEKYCFQMKGMYWNIKGIADLAKYRYIANVIKEQTLETGKQDMQRMNLSHHSGGQILFGIAFLLGDRSEGDLLGINAAVLQILMILEGEFLIKFHLCNKINNFKWILMAVYGPAQDNFKTAFLSKLVRTCQQNPLPTLIGGDFNIMRNSKVKNNDRFNKRWPFLFNAMIDSFDLWEIELFGCQFTWVNSLPTPMFEKLDRVLMTTKWEFKYP